MKFEIDCCWTYDWQRSSEKGDGRPEDKEWKVGPDDLQRVFLDEVIDGESGGKTRVDQDQSWELLRAVLDDWHADDASQVLTHNYDVVSQPQLVHQVFDSKGVKLMSVVLGISVLVTLAETWTR